MRINLRYLQNTLEQLVMFVPGLLGLAIYSHDGGAMRAVVAATIVWIATRIAFWIGYHRSSAQRAYGAPGMLQSMLVLLYVCSRFGYEIAGGTGAVAVVVLFLGTEGVLVWGTRPLRG
jgi:fatty-acid desaturase